MTTTAPDLSGVRKAALLLVQLGPEHSAPILRSLRPEEVEALMAEVARMEDADEATHESVVREFEEMAMASRSRRRGGFDIAEEMLVKTVPEHAKEILGRLSARAAEAPFVFARGADPAVLLRFLGDEHPQTVALVIAHLEPAQAAALLAALPQGLQADVAHRLAVMDKTTPDVVRVVERHLRASLEALGGTGDQVHVGGIDPLVGIMSRAQRETERSILKGIEERDPGLAENLRAKMFSFTDVVSLDDRTVQVVLRSVDTKDLALALKGAPDPVRDKILSNMSERAAATLQDEVDVLGPVRAAQVEEARSAVVRSIRALEESGDIVISRSGGGDDLVV